MPAHPNILILMDDEHHPDITGFAGNDVVRTPTLDRLAESGVVFENAYCPSPKCVPARQSIYSGQRPSSCDCRGWVDLEPGAMTYARQFSRNAYLTVSGGHLHHLGWDQMQGWRHRIGGQGYVSTGYIEDRNEAMFDKYEPSGNPHVGERSLWSAAKEIKQAGIGTPRWNRGLDDYATDGVIEFIEEYFASPYYDMHQSNRPVLLQLSLIQPHYPFLTDAERFEYYLNRVSPTIDEPDQLHPKLDTNTVRPGEEVTTREIQRATAAYYGMVEAVDASYGRVLDKLRQVGEDLDDWIIVFFSDHGELLGEHGTWMKDSFYESSARVPMIIRWPEGFEGGRRITRNVSTVDLFATLCDLAGISQPPNLDSRSLEPLLRGEETDWSNEAICELYRGGPNVMIKRDDLKYQYYPEESSEVLFDLEADPDETTNRISDSEYQAAIDAFRGRLTDLDLDIRPPES